MWPLFTHRDKSEGGGSVSTPTKDGKLTLDSLSRDELLVVAKREKEMTNRLKGEAQGAAALERSGRAAEAALPAHELAALVDELPSLSGTAVAAPTELASAHERITALESEVHGLTQRVHAEREEAARHFQVAQEAVQQQQRQLATARQAATTARQEAALAAERIKELKEKEAGVGRAREGQGE